MRQNADARRRQLTVRTFSVIPLQVLCNSSFFSPFFNSESFRNVPASAFASIIMKLLLHVHKIDGLGVANEIVFSVSLRKNGLCKHLLRSTLAKSSNILKVGI